MNKFLIVSVLCILAIATLHAQEEPEEVYRLVPLEAELTAEERLLLAVSSKDYPVTPGDVYRLTFLLANEPVSNEIVVESDYTLNLNIFGKVNAENMTFAELKPIVEKRIADAYPRSLPSLNIVSVGIFQVLIKGEVPKTSYVKAWGLSRLSSAVQDHLGPYSSIREIGIVSRDGILRKYDLFKALQLGVIDEDPYILPGDVIIVYRRDRKAEIRGEVFRPGEYQLKENEGLQELIKVYGRGFTNRADKSRIRLDRYAEKRAQTYYFDFTKGIPPSLELKDNDIVTVPVKSSTLPIVFFEGAVLPPPTEAEVVLTEAEEVGVETYNRILHPFIEGESLLDALLAIQDSLATAADLSNAYLIRQDSANPIPVNLERLIYDYDPTDDIALQPFDRVIIPSLRFTVSVLGDVENAGIFPYVPQKTYSYYLSLAGGIPPGKPIDYVTVLDVNDNPRELTEIIEPEDRIIVSQSLISVAGAVYDPGSYPHIPGKDFEYYVRLAGGIDPELNSDDKVSISDSAGNSLEAGTTIQPGDRIFVETNDFAYNFNRYFPIITTGIAFITTIITIVDLLAD
jgi:protein involved in polysaccharide export with SLBB domain